MVWVICRYDGADAECGTIEDPDAPARMYLVFYLRDKFGFMVALLRQWLGGSRIVGTTTKLINALERLWYKRGRFG